MGSKAAQWFRALIPVRRKTVKASLQQAATIKKGQIFILPTLQGVVFALMLVVMLLAAVNYNNNMTYALCFILTSISVISIFHSYLNLLEVVVQPQVNLNCFAGEQAIFKLQLTDTQHRERVQVHVKSHIGPSAIADISLDHHTVLSLTSAAKKRGRLLLKRITVHSRYPLGLFRAWSYIEIESEVIVYPKPIKDSLPLSFSHAEGHRTDANEQGSDDFHGLRHYQTGDSPRRIHWKSWAQDKPMMSKQFHRNRSSKIWLDWDKTSGQQIELRLSQLCHWVLYADSHNHVYGLKIPGTTLQPGQGERHRQQCLTALALFDQHPNSTL